MPTHPFTRSLNTLASAALLLVIGAGAPTGEAVPVDPVARIQAVVDDLTTRLAVTADVTVVIVPSNPLLVSVEVLQPRKAFLLSFEQRFVDELDADELAAVVAHELGHVWIFTHHPFLQTEQLANRIARQVVSSDTLARVYTKVWERSGVKGDLRRFLGE